MIFLRVSLLLLPLSSSQFVSLSLQTIELLLLACFCHYCPIQIEYETCNLQSFAYCLFMNNRNWLKTQTHTHSHTCAEKEIKRIRRKKTSIKNRNWKTIHQQLLNSDSILYKTLGALHLGMERMKRKNSSTANCIALDFRFNEICLQQLLLQLLQLPATQIVVVVHPSTKTKQKHQKERRHEKNVVFFLFVRPKKQHKKPIMPL